MAKRKMSNGAYVKLILKLSAEGYDLSHHLDLKDLYGLDMALTSLLQSKRDLECWKLNCQHT